MRFLPLLIAASVVCAWGQSNDGLRVWGVFQNSMFGLGWLDGPNENGVDFAGTGIFTVNAVNRNTETVKIEASGDLNLFYGRYADLFNTAIPGSLRLSGSQGPFLFDLRKLYAGFFMEYADLFIGRQIINYGTGMLFSPVDVFSTVNLADLSFRRSGSDVVRIRVPFGALSGAELTAGIASSDNKIVAVKTYGSIAGASFSGIGIYREENREIIAGATGKGDLVAGIYGEIAEHLGTDGEHRYFSGMAGADYSLSNEWFFSTEYLYSEFNAPDSQGSLGLVSGTGLQFTGRHNLFASVRYSFNELSSIGLSSILELQNGGKIITSQYSYNILQNADLVLYLQYFNLDELVSPELPDLLYGMRLSASF